MSRYGQRHDDVARIAQRCTWLRSLVAPAAVLACLIPVAQAAVVLEQPEPQLRLDLPGHTGEVRALAFTPDSRRLLSGGRDKVVIVWQLGDGDGLDDQVRERDIVRRQVREQAFRWQVARGPRGAIQALAIAPAGDPPVAALGGYGAMGSTGEIVLVDARDGSWIKTLGGATDDGTPDGLQRTGHRESVVALEFTADGAWLVSQDLDGQSFAWQRAAGWQPRELAAREETRLGVAGAKSLRDRMPRLRPLAVLDKTRVAIPILTSRPDAETPVWRIRIVDLARPADPGRILSFDFFGVVTALAATPDGRRLVAADYSGQVVVLDPDGVRPAIVWEVKPVAESLAILPDGTRVVVGVATDGTQPPHLEVWDVAAAARRVSRSATAAPVRAMRISTDGRWLARSGGERHAVLLESIESLGLPDDARPVEAVRRFGGIGMSVTRVAFSTAAADARLLEQPADGRPEGVRDRNIMLRRQAGAGDAAAAPSQAPRRLAVSRARPTADAPPPFDAAFDIDGLALTPVGEEADWAPAAGRAAAWTIAPAATSPQGVDRWQLARGGRPGGVIDLVIGWQGLAGAGGTAVSWLTKPGADEPWAVAIGTDLGIFVYKLEEAAGAACRVVRRFRGNENRLLSLAVSEDGRWLASGGGDGIVMVWSLSGVGRDEALADRWGVSLRVEAGRAIVSGVDEAGPLAGRDVRVGDAITSISWLESTSAPPIEHVDGEAIRTALAAMPWDTEVTFIVERGEDGRKFNRRPAWENLAALYLAANREWSLWTPRGYYAASANGDRLFGWLVNRGIDRLPRFFRARQFRRKLERPDVISRLLAAGSLDAALRAAARDVPDASAIVLPQQIAQAPEVRIVSPTPVDIAQGGKLTVRVEVDLPAGVPIDRIQAHASGDAAATPARLLGDAPAAEGRPRRQTYEWELDLPAQDRHFVTVFAATRDGPTDEQSVLVDAVGPPLRTRDPRLYVLAAGVNTYANAPNWRRSGFELDDLRFCVKDAEAVREALTTRSLELFDVGSDRLLADADVTREGWQAAMQSLVSGVRREVEPDDLLVLFLSGHGMRNIDAGGTYAYLCHDAELGQSPLDGGIVPTGIGAIGWRDLAALADLPCRKLALVDTCHSGALGPAARSTAVREFQENMIVVLAAAADDEPSQESDDWGHGAFTKVLLAGLAGEADVGGSSVPARRTATHATAQGDGIVSLDELIDYVRRTVRQLTKDTQNPTVSPEPLWAFVRPNLVKVPPNSVSPETTPD